MRYLIDVRGLLDEDWSGPFEDLGLVLGRDESVGVTRLVSGEAFDQARLRQGTLNGKFAPIAKQVTRVEGV